MTMDFGEDEMMLNSPLLSPILNALAPPPTPPTTASANPQPTTFSFENTNNNVMQTMQLEDSKPLTSTCQFNTESINQLELHFNRFVNETQSRLSTIEQGIGLIVNNLTQRGLATPSADPTKPLLFKPTPPTPTSNPNIFAAPSSPVVESSSVSTTCSSCSSPGPSSPSLTDNYDEDTLTLTMAPSESVWYTKRPLPWFDVTISDDSGSRPAHTEGWEIVMRLVDGNGKYADHALLPSGAVAFPVTEGRAIVSGLKFAAVSSRNGGSFQLEARLVKPERLAKVVTPVRSSSMRVLSERLYSEAKANSVLEMKPTDTVIHIPGIGKKYTTRLADCGIRTVADLAGLEVSDNGRQDVLDLLDSVKKERGTLTESKLMEIVKDAKVVVKRAAMADTTNATTTPTATSIMASPEMASANSNDSCPTSWGGFMLNGEQAELDCAASAKRRKLDFDFDFEPMSWDTDNVDMMLNDIAIDEEFVNALSVPVY